MSKKEEFNYLLEKLQNSKTEDEVYSNLKRILKESNTHLYKDIILENPYFKSIVKDVRQEVLNDIELIRDTLKKEIESINEEIDKLSEKDINNIHINKFKSLKRECVSLIYEIDERKKDLINLI